jgi:hypothetical protein
MTVIIVLTNGFPKNLVLAFRALINRVESSLLNGYQHFEGKYCLHFQGRTVRLARRKYGYEESYRDRNAQQAHDVLLKVAYLPHFTVSHFSTLCCGIHHVFISASLCGNMQILCVYVLPWFSLYK